MCTFIIFLASYCHLSLTFYFPFRGTNGYITCMKTSFIHNYFSCDFYKFSIKLFVWKVFSFHTRDFPRHDLGDIGPFPIQK